MRCPAPPCPCLLLQFTDPQGLAVDPSGATVFVVDPVRYWHDAGQLMMFDTATGAFLGSTLFTNSRTNDPGAIQSLFGVAVGPTSLFTLDQSCNRVTR